MAIFWTERAPAQHLHRRGLPPQPPQRDLEPEQRAVQLRDVLTAVLAALVVVGSLWLVGR